MSNPPNILFPLAPDTAETLFNPLNRFVWVGLVKTAINAIATEIITTDTIDIPAQLANNYIQIDSELMWVVSVDNSGADKKIIVERAAGGSTAAAHVANTLIENVIAAEYHNQLRLAIMAMQTRILELSSAQITANINASPFTLTYTGQLASVYTIAISVTNSGNIDIINRSYTISHYSGQLPVYYEGFTFETNPGSIAISVDGFVAGQSTFNINVTGANGGSMIVELKREGASK